MDIPIFPQSEAPKPREEMRIEALEVALVYPDDADDGAGRLSVHAGIGTAILDRLTRAAAPRDGTA